MKVCASMMAAVAATAVLAMNLMMVATAAAGRSTGSAVVFKASLSGAAEVPPASSSATGVAMALFSDARYLSLAWSFSGLPAPVDLAAGIHLCQAPAGTVGPTLAPLTADVALLAGGTGGCGWSHLALNATTAKALLAGNIYLNIFIKGSPGGGLRGQLRAAINGATANEGEVVEGPSSGPGNGFFGEDDDVVGLSVSGEPEASTEDEPEASADAAESDNDKDTFVTPSDGPTGEGDEAADFELEASTPADFPAVDEPDASKPPATDGDYDGFERDSTGGLAPAPTVTPDAITTPTPYVVRAQWE